MVIMNTWHAVVCHAVAALNACRAPFRPCLMLQMVVPGLMLHAFYSWRDRQLLDHQQGRDGRSPPTNSLQQYLASWPHITYWRVEAKFPLTNCKSHLHEQIWQNWAISLNSQKNRRLPFTKRLSSFHPKNTRWPSWSWKTPCLSQDHQIELTCHSVRGSPSYDHRNPTNNQYIPFAHIWHRCKIPTKYLMPLCSLHVLCRARDYHVSFLKMMCFDFVTC